MFVRFPFDDECARMLGDVVVVLFNTRVLRGRKRNPRRGRVRVPPARVRSHHVLHYCVYVSSFAGKLLCPSYEGKCFEFLPEVVVDFSRLFKTYVI